MGTEFQAILAGKDPEYLRDAGSQALDEVERLEAQLSHYRPDSDVTDLNVRAYHQAVRLEPLLYRLLRHAVELSEATGGAFDCALGALIRCWGFFRGQGALAEEAAVKEALEQCGSRWLELDDDARTVRFLRPVQVHLGAIGKGYAVDRMVGVLREVGVRAALVHGGTSTLYALGAPPGDTDWSVGLCDPSDRTRRLGVVRLRDRALSTSGDYEQFFEIAGRRYSHLLDPRTGYPAVGMRSATVAAASATDTDALSTAAFVLGPTGASEVLERFPGTGAVLLPDVSLDSGRVVEVHGEIDFSLEDAAAGTRGEET
ncbi:MAG: FAD:protein FMN transferase [Armatimonadota bacterium]